MVQIQWQPLVERIDKGLLESKAADGNVDRLYESKKNSFLSEPRLVRDTLAQTKRRKPFLLVGELFTGKNIFLRLLASGSTPAIGCEDHNIEGTEQANLTKWFGKGGVVDANRRAVIHFDMLHHAKNWPQFLDRILTLAVDNKFQRVPDNEWIEVPEVRVVGGAIEELLEEIEQGRYKVLEALIGHLAMGGIVKMAPLREQTYRVSTILEEQLACHVLESTDRGAAKREIQNLSSISEANLEKLKNDSWPDNFKSMKAFVETALGRNWDVAIDDHSIPRK